MKEGGGGMCGGGKGRIAGSTRVSWNVAGGRGKGSYMFATIERRKEGRLFVFEKVR